MATLKVTQHVEILLDDEPIRLGSLVSPGEITVAGNVFRARMTVEDDYQEETLWETGDGGLTTFDVCVIESDEDVLVEFRDDNATDAFAVITVAGGIPFVLAADDLIADDSGASPLSGDGSDDTPDTIDRIVVKRNVADDEGDAIVSLLLFD